MPAFEYQARDQNGEQRSGIIEAATQDRAVDVLHRNGLIVTSIHERAQPLLSRISFGGGVRQKDVVILSRQLSTLFEAQIPVVQSLKTLIAESERPALKKVLAEVLDDITGGMALSQAFARHPDVFTAFYVNLVRSGEESGKLQDVFTYLADYLDRAYYLSVKARNAMIYPAFVLVAFVAVLGLMLTFVFPSLATIFEESGQELPLYTRIILGVGIFFRSWGFFFLLGLAIGGVYLWRWAQTIEGRMVIHRLQITVPIMGGLYRKIFMARLSDNLKTLISGGIPILRALAITGDVVGNVIYQRALADAVESVKSGNTISSAFERSQDIPVFVTQMIRIGETSGRLDFILESVAKFYQREVDSALENLVSLIEPLLVVILGGGVALLVASVIVPLYNLAGSF